MRTKSALAKGLDWLAVGLLLGGLVIFMTGGFGFTAGGVRVSARSGSRALIAAALVIALRFIAERRTRPLSSPLSRLFDGRADHVNGADGPVSWSQRAMALLGFTAITVLFLFPQLRNLYSVPDLGDPLFSIWRIGWVYHKLLLGDAAPLFSPNIFYPQPMTLAYSDAMLLPALTTAPLLAVGVHPVVAYNIVLVLSFVASACAMYFLVERLTHSAAAAFVAGVIFGFYPYRFEHYSHFELQMTYCMPLALLAVHRFVDTGRLRYALAFSLLGVAQLYSSMYYGVFLVPYVIWIFLALAPHRTGLKKLIPRALGAASLALLLAWPLVRVYSAAGMNDRSPGVVRAYSAKPSDYMAPHFRSALWNGRLPGDGQPRVERALFPGMMALALALVAVVPPVGRIRAGYAGALLMAFAISLGLNSPVYGVAYDWLPFIRGLRAPSRASILVGMTLALLAGFGVRRIMARTTSAWAPRALMALLTLALVFDLRPVLSVERVWKEPPAIYREVRSDAILAELPMGGDPAAAATDTPHMYFSLWHWARLVNGYSGHAPPGYGDFLDVMRQFPRDTAMQQLRSRGVTHVTVNCALYSSGCDRLLAAMDHMPEFRLTASTVWEGQPVRLYELR